MTDDSTTPRVNMDPAGDATEDINDPRYFNLMSLKQRTAKYSAFLNRPALTAYMDQLEVPSLDGTPDHRRNGNGNGGASRSALGGNLSSSSSSSSSKVSSLGGSPLGGKGSFGDSSGSIESKLGGGGGGSSGGDAGAAGAGGESKHAGGGEVVAGDGTDGLRGVIEAVHAVQGRAYCFLPLPMPTGLPVHVNGAFALTKNRRDLWRDEGGLEDTRDASRGGSSTSGEGGGALEKYSSKARARWNQVRIS